MNLIYNSILDIILVLFPILVYFVYSCYKTLKHNKYDKLILRLTLISSLYLYLKFGQIDMDNKLLLLFCNIPIVIAYLKKDEPLAIFLSISNLIYCYFIYDINIIVMIIKYLSYLIIYYLAKKGKVNNYRFISLIAILQGFFTSFEYFFTSNSKFDILFQLFILVIIYYIVTFAILILFNLINKVTSMYANIRELEKEKQIQTSLFTLTHEIKNPIAVCKGYLDMLNLDNKEDAIRYISIIKQEIDRSLNIMTDFMQFNKIKIKKELFDVSMLLEDIYDGFKLLTDNKNIKLKYISRDEEIYLDADYDRIKQVLVNIVKNSIEAIKESGIIKINTKNDKNNCYIIIEDDGQGMDKEELNHLTELFYTTKEKGSGLGVALSNEIIKAHNGTLNYTSVKNKGTKVTIKLPL